MIPNKIICLLQKPGNGRPLAFLRIAVGIVAILELVVLWPNLKDIYGNQGYIEWVISDNLFSTSHLPTIGRVATFLNSPFLSDDEMLYFFLLAYIAGLAAMVLGYKANFMAFFAWLMHLTINNSAIMYGYGIESFIHLSLFYLIFMPSSFYFNLFLKRNSVLTEENVPYANIWMIVLQIHLCIVYFNAGVAKLQGNDWLLGEAIWRAVAQPASSPFNMFWLASVPWLSAIATWAVLVLETGYPIGIWLPATRKYWLSGILLMHIGIGFLMNMYGFAAIMIVLNVAAFGWPYVTFLYDCCSKRCRVSYIRNRILPE